jgi:hypothetical protein
MKAIAHSGNPGGGQERIIGKRAEGGGGKMKH